MSDWKNRLTEELCCPAPATNVGPKFLVICMFSVRAWSFRDQPWGQWTWHQESLLLITRFTSWGMWQTQRLVVQRRTGRLPCHDFCFQGCLIKRFVAFSTESLNEVLYSLPELIQCQSLWLWSASEPNPSWEGWLAAMGDSSKFLSRLCKTDFISFWVAFVLMLYQIHPVNFFSACTVPIWLLHSLSVPVNVSQVVSHSRDNADTQY